MALTKSNQRSANRVAVDVGATGTRPASKGAMAILAVSVLAALWAVAMMTAPGRVGYYYFFIYAEFYMGVLSLVTLSITIMIGLVATDRLVLSIRQRVLLQSAHRTTGVIAVASLFVHVWTKLVEDHIRLIDVFIPFLSPGNRLYVGFGTISGLIMVLVMWTGIARSRFIGRGQPWMWRSVHAISYLMWPIALVHGLAAGRPAKAWVTVSYIVCILFVLIGLAVRLSVSLNRKKDFSSTASTGIKPVGKLVPTTSPALKKRPGRRGQERVAAETLAPVAVVDTWQPAAAPVTAPPMMAPPVPEPPAGDRRGGRRYVEDEPPMPAPRQRRPAPDERFEDEVARGGRRRVEDDFEYEDEPRPRGRRHADGPAETGTRMRRPDLEDTSTRMRRVELEDTGTRMRRAELDDTGTRMRRAELDDTRSFRPDFDEPAPRPRRYAEDDEPAPRSRRLAVDPAYEDPAYEDPRFADPRFADPRFSDDRYEQAPLPRSSRHADTGEFDELPRQRGGSRYADSPRYEAPRRGREIEDAPRARRDRGAEDDRADSGRHSRSEFVDFAGPADDNYLEPDDTPTLVDMAARRARRATQHEPVRSQVGRGARRNGRGRANDDVADDSYWSQLRGEAN
jgi:DMSO/TMAO reductase YedYZ heme-binding membrane subunit